MIKCTCGENRGICVDCMKDGIAELEAELGWANATIAALQEITCVSGDRQCAAYRAKVQRLVDKIEDVIAAGYISNLDITELKQAIAEVECINSLK